MSDEKKDRRIPKLDLNTVSRMTDWEMEVISEEESLRSEKEEREHWKKVDARIAVKNANEVSK